MKREAGVTLLELLIAVTLVALLSVGMLYAMRVGLNTLDRSNARLMQNRRVASVERILEQQVANIMPMKAVCASENGPPSQISFFQGDAATMRFVSAFTLHEGTRGNPTMLEFQVIPGENDQGVRLVVNEVLYSGPVPLGATCLSSSAETGPAFRKVEIGLGSFVLADKLAFCRMSFREPAVAPAAPKWVLHWKQPVLPEAIRIEMAPLDPEAARVNLSTLTIPVHVTRWPLGQYEF
jgi:type II secretory pathway component PulJ